MTIEIGILLGLLLVMAILFITEKLPVDLTAFAGLAILLGASYLEPEEAFTGFASPAVITMLSVFIVSAGLEKTGVAEALAARLQRVIGKGEVPLIVLVMLLAGVLSAFMNNIAAAAILLPAVASLARQADVSPSRLFIPLAYGAVLGGMTTMVGTPPNILTSEVLGERGLRPFGLFEYTPYGVVLLVAGVLFMVTVGRHLLPRRAPSRGATERGDLLSIYRLRERLFSVRVPRGSFADGQSIAETRIGQTLGIKILSIVRGGREMPAPDPHSILRGGDLLLVDGNHDDLQELLKVQGVEPEDAAAIDISHPSDRVGATLVRLGGESPLLGQNLRELGFRSRFGAVVAGIWRGEEVQGDELASHVLREGDELLVLGPEEVVEGFSQRPHLTVLERGGQALKRLESRAFLVRVPEGSPLAGTTLGQSRIGEFVGMLVIGGIREGKTLLNISPEAEIRGGDELILVGEPARILGLLQVGKVEVVRDIGEPRLETKGFGVFEAVVAPRSTLAGKTFRDLQFRDRYGMTAIALWREGAPVLGDMSDVRLHVGDGLLLQGPWAKLRMLANDADFVVLAEAAQRPARPKRAPFAVGALFLMVALVVSGALPIQAAAFCAAVVAILTRCVTMQEAYRAIEWKAIFLVAAILPVGIAMERTGAALLIANSITAVAGDLGPYVVLVALMVLSSLFSQALDGAPTVVLLAPVVIQTGEQMGISPYPLMMGVGLAASAAFITPFSHKANLLVMGAGGYRTMDYAKVGTPLTIVVLAILAFMIPMLIPFEPPAGGSAPGPGEATVEAPAPSPENDAAAVPAAPDAPAPAGHGSSPGQDSPANVPPPVTGARP